MIVSSIYVRNFRCIRDETLKLDALTALVGANGTGKSTFLQALALFYSTTPKLSDEDICHHRNGDEVEISVTYTKLSQPAAERFAKYLQEGELTVTRVLNRAENGTEAKYHGKRLQCPEFLPIRQAAATAAKTLYSELRRQQGFLELPAWGRSKAEALTAMDDWETNHRDSCQWLIDEGEFFGVKSVAAGYLGDFTRFVLVPAVRDASGEAADGRSSLFADLMDLVIRSSAVGDDEIEHLNQHVTERYREIIEGSKGAELRRVEAELTTELAAFVPDVNVQLAWQPMDDVSLPAPRAIAKIGEDGYPSAIERKGHGLQRAFIMTLLQYLEKARNSIRAPDGQRATAPDLSLGVEEPELYQHPDRQRHIAQVLRDLSVITDDTRPSTQVIYTTHSPHFVGLDRFDNIRRTIKRRHEEGCVPTTRLTSTTLDALAHQLATLLGRDPAQFNATTLRGRLMALMTPWMNEGFFAEVVVLVEGEQDRAAILAMARSLGHTLERNGITVIPCAGKPSLDRPALIFKSLNIPTFVIWDSDHGRNDPRPELNRLLLRMCGKPETDYPAMVDDNCAAFAVRLEETLETEIGSTVFDILLDQLKTEFEMSKDDILKNPSVMTELITRARVQGATSPSLEQIIQNVVALRAERAALLR